MRWFSNLNAAPRLLISFGLLVALSLGVCCLALIDQGKANQRLEALYQQDMSGAMAVDNIAIARFELGRSARDAILNLQNPIIVAGNEKTMLKDFAQIHASIDVAQRSFYSKEGIAALGSIRDALPSYEKAFHDLFARLDARDLDGARAALTVATSLGAPLFAGAEEARISTQARAADKFRRDLNAFETARWILVGAALLAIILGAGLATMIARSFSVPLALAVSTLEKVADGDLTVSLEIDTADELGRMAAALNHALETMRSTLEDVSSSAASASSASQELAAAADAISSGAQQQAASLEETSASLEQITATVRQSADNARQASQLAIGSRDSAERGQAVVTEAIASMAEINAAAARISDIISTIDEIAFQTNLLAVNAAVEAARAGEEGRGFAVVAKEVRSLAQRSAGAAREIKTLIQDSLRKVENGSELVDKSGDTLRGIVISVKSVTDIVGEIATAAAEQSSGVEQVNAAMTQMDSVTQSNAAQTEQLSSTAQALAEQSRQLMELVSTFVLSKAGGSPPGLVSNQGNARLRNALPVRPTLGIRTTVATKARAFAAGIPPAGKHRAAMAVLQASEAGQADFEEF